MLQWWQNLVGKRAEAAHRAKRDNPTDHQTAAVYQKSAPNCRPCSTAGREPLGRAHLDRRRIGILQHLIGLAQSGGHFNSSMLRAAVIGSRIIALLVISNTRLVAATQYSGSNCGITPPSPHRQCRLRLERGLQARSRCAAQGRHDLEPALPGGNCNCGSATGAEARPDRAH